MRHCKHRYQLGVKKEHREALMASLGSALFRHDRIQTTLAYAKALRPFAEKVVTLAKKAAATDDTAKKLHLRRQALSKLRDVSAVHFIFDEKVGKFQKRQGGYVRIYKLVPRVGDGANMAIVELVEADDKPYNKASEKPAKKAAPKKAKAEKTDASKVEESPAAAVEEAPKAEKKVSEKKPAAKKTAAKKPAAKKAKTEEKTDK